MKKTFIFKILVTILLSIPFYLLFFPTSVQAALSCTATLDKTEVKPGETFSVTISFSDGKKHPFNYSFDKANLVGQVNPNSNPYTFTLTAPNTSFSGISFYSQARVSPAFGCTGQLSNSTTPPPAGVTPPPAGVTPPPAGVTPSPPSGNNDTSIKSISDPVKFSSLGDVISAALPIVFGLVAFLAIVVFSIGGLRYMVSRGDPKAADGARGTMTGAVIGLILVLGAASVSGVFKSIFGIGFFGGNNTAATVTNNSFDLRCAFKVSESGACIGDKYATAADLVTQVLLLLTAVGAAVFFFMLLWGGIRYMSARGDEKAVASARSTLTSAFIGLLLMIGALVIIRLIAQVVFNSGSLISK